MTSSSKLVKGSGPEVVLHSIVSNRDGSIQMTITVRYDVTGTIGAPSVHRAKSRESLHAMQTEMTKLLVRDAQFKFYGPALEELKELQRMLLTSVDPAISLPLIAQIDAVEKALQFREVKS